MGPLIRFSSPPMRGAPSLSTSLGVGRRQSSHWMRMIMTRGQNAVLLMETDLAGTWCR